MNRSQTSGENAGTGNRPTLWSVPEEPVSSREDLENPLQELVERLLIFCKAGHSDPLLISGDWGAGKTSVLKVLENTLKNTSDGDPDGGTVWFEAWHHERNEGLLPALMRAIWEAGPKMKREKLANRHLAARLFSCALTATFRVAPLAASALGAGAPLIALLKGLKIADIAKDVEGLEFPGSSEPPPDPLEALHDHLAELVTALWGDAATPIIFIDDLDRCSPEGTVHLLDAVRMLVSRRKDLRCRFIVALDDSIAVRAISAKFRAVEGYDGNRYLEKIFPYTFRIPPLDVHDVDQFIDGFLGQIDAGDVFHGDRRDALSTALSDPVFANPRLMKRAVRRFGMVIEFERQIPGPKTSPNFDKDRDVTLARWIVACERWPRLRRLMQRRGIDYWLEIGSSLEDPLHRIPGPEAEKLLAEPGALAWLQHFGLITDRAAFERFQEAEYRLGRWGL